MKILPKTPLPISPQEHQKLRDVAKGFETIFVNQMVNAMRQTVPKSGFIPQSNAERVYQSMLDAEYSQKISEGEYLGLSDLIYQHLLRESSSR